MEKLLVALIEQRAEVADQSLKQPADRSAFEYGRVSGMYQGLTMAIVAVQDLLAEKEDEE